MSNTRPHRSRFALSIAVCLAAPLIALAATGTSGCNVVLGLNDYRDCCKPIGIGDPPDCVYCDADAGKGGSGGQSANGGGGATASSSSTGAGGCNPGDMKTCWDGPAAAEKVGICTDGMETCQKDRTWSKCEGETLPKAETCASTDDEDCNGLDCIEWAEAFFDEDQKLATATATGVAVDSKNQTLVVGGFTSASLKIGSTVLKNPAQFIPRAPTGFVTLLDATGKAIWAKGIGFGNLNAVTIDAGDNVYVAGTASDATAFGAEAIAMGQFILKIDGTGKLIWLKEFPSTGTAGAPSSLANCGNGVYVAGAYYSATDFGQGAQPLINGTASSYVAELAQADGSTFAAQTFEATTISGDVIGPFVGAGASCKALDVYFNFANSVTFGGRTITSAGGIDIGSAQVQLAPTFIHVPIAFGDSQNQVLLNATTAPDGTALMSGVFQGTVTFDGGAHSLTSTTSNADPRVGDGFAYAGNRLLFGFGRQGKSFSTDVAPDGSVVVTGAFTGGTLNVGSITLDGTQGAPVLLAKFDPVGTPLWARAYQHPTDNLLSFAAASYSDNSTAIVGTTNAFPLNFGSGAVNTIAQPQVGFAARFAP